jgi:hypothetical protein
MTIHKISICSYCALRRMCVTADGITYVCNTCGSRMGLTPERMRMYVGRDKGQQVVDETKPVLPGTTPPSSEALEATDQILEKRKRLYKPKS